MLYEDFMNMHFSLWIVFKTFAVPCGYWETYAALRHCNTLTGQCRLHKQRKEFPAEISRTFVHKWTGISAETGVHRDPYKQKSACMDVARKANAKWEHPKIVIQNLPAFSCFCSAPVSRQSQSCASGSHQPLTSTGHTSLGHYEQLHAFKEKIQSFKLYQ